MNNSDIGSGLINYDFERFFPHKSWVSGWATDETYRAGFCYKILSVRDEIDGRVELVLVRSFRDGTKEELHRARISIGEADDAASIFHSASHKSLDWIMKSRITQRRGV